MPKGCLALSGCESTEEERNERRTEDGKCCIQGMKERTSLMSEKERSQASAKQKRNNKPSGGLLCQHHCCSVCVWAVKPQSFCVWAHRFQKVSLKAPQGVYIVKIIHFPRQHKCTQSTGFRLSPNVLVQQRCRGMLARTCILAVLLNERRNPIFFRFLSVINGSSATIKAYFNTK